MQIKFITIKSPNEIKKIEKEVKDGWKLDSIHSTNLFILFTLRK